MRGWWSWTRSFWFGWWSTVPGWAKPVLLAAGITLFAWILSRAIPYMIHLLYLRVLERLEEARARLLLNALKGRGTLAAGFSDDLIIKESGMCPWLARKAMRWERRKKKGLI